MGSPLTEGNHLYINRKNEKWKEALIELLGKISNLQDQLNANTITLRDFDADDIELRDLLLAEAYVKIDLPDAHVLEKDKIDWESVDEYLTRISYKSRKNFKRDVLKYEEFYDVTIVEDATKEQINYWYKLYKNVKDKSFELNTFDLSKDFFVGALKDPNWDVILLTLKEEFNDKEERNPIAVVFCYKAEKTYSPMIVGLDYFYLFAYKNYKQVVYQIIKRAKQLGLEKVYLGFTASIEKQKFGATPVAKVAYIQTNDSFNMEVLEFKKVQSRGKERAKLVKQYSESIKNQSLAELEA